MQKIYRTLYRRRRKKANELAEKGLSRQAFSRHAGAKPSEKFPVKKRSNLDIPLAW
jgi:hypothetical protein